MELKRTVYPLSKAIEIIENQLDIDFSLDELLDLAFNEEIELCYYLLKSNSDNPQDKILFNFKYSNDETKNFLERMNGMDSLVEPENIPFHMIFSNYCGMFMFWERLYLSENSGDFSVRVLSCSMPFKLLIKDIRNLINSNKPITVNHFEMCNSDTIKTKLLEKEDIIFLNTVLIVPKLQISIDDLSITASELERFISINRKPSFRLVKSQEHDTAKLINKVGIKSHPLKDQTILIARNTKNHYLEQGIDLGLNAIAKKIKSHNDFSNKGLPSPEQMAKWFTADGIEASKTTRTFDFELIFKD